MPLVPMTALLKDALARGYGVGYFEAWDTYSLEAVCEAAEEEQAPVILGFGCMMMDSAWLDNGGIALLAGIGRVVANRAQVPTALLLNEAQTLDQAMRAMELGFNAVMLDTSAWPLEEAEGVVRQLARAAHARGVAVEAELGRLPDAIAGGSGGIDDSTARLTDPEQAAAFVERTGADCLAVSIGNVHLLTASAAPVDMARLEAIHRSVRVPLVIHGGTSFPAEAVPAAIANGVAKFNVGTAIKQAFVEGMREAVGRWPARVDVHAALGSHAKDDFLNAGKAAMKAKVRELIRLYGGSGRAVNWKPE
ncbi:MAG TPA: class II fructose-bisphosphate aldolase [Chthonomonadaceae bacterium]|nr:class II fructose-bisphosphate aldolase [Chthonomonadaceae bacterium]